MLFFDEADAIFGKRSEVRDAHDRYANIESAYLLQRLETFDGLAVLATNLRANIDEAFTRRLDAIIDFPAPTPELRRSLWGAAWPPPLPLADDSTWTSWPTPSSWPAATSARRRPPRPTWRRPRAPPVGDAAGGQPPWSRSTASWAGWCWSASSATTTPDRLTEPANSRSVPVSHERLWADSDAHTARVNTG